MSALPWLAQFVFVLAFIFWLLAGLAAIGLTAEMVLNADSPAGVMLIMLLTLAWWAGGITFLGGIFGWWEHIG
jgi:hypothetical protein